MLTNRIVALLITAEILVELAKVRLLLHSPWRARALAAPALGRKRSVNRRRLARRLDALASSGPRPASCLERALALRNLLARRGIGGELKIGVRFDDGRLEGHAWLSETSDDGFDGFLSLRSARGEEP